MAALTAASLSCGISVCAQKKSLYSTGVFAAPSLTLGPTSDLRRNKLTCTRCSNKSGSPRPSSGDNESKVILDAFFLGKAFGEALNERIESTVGEFLSVIGQWQAEQQKQVLDFQEEVVERAKKAKERAALETMDGRENAAKPLREPPRPTNGSTFINNRSTSEDPLQEILRDD
ncbi:uncharacterized protein At4g13200, chloroplastic [Carex rostrata]